MTPELGREVLEFTHGSEKTLYRTAADAVAQALKLRPIFLDRQPKVERFAFIARGLGRPGLSAIADNVLRHWLLKKNEPLLTHFLDSLGIAHEKGAVETLPPSIEEAKLHVALESLLAKYPHETVAVYLHAFNQMNESKWTNLDEHVQTDPRLQLPVAR